jgi:hypothetical protein
MLALCPGSSAIIRVSRPVPRPNQTPFQRLAVCTADHRTSSSVKEKNVWSQVLLVLPQEQSGNMMNIEHISKGDTKFHDGLMFVVINKHKMHFIN